MRERRWIRTPLILSMLTAGLALSGTPATSRPLADGPPATTALSEARALAMPSGGTGMLTYRARHEFTGPAGPGSQLPGAVLSRRDNADAFRGLYVDAGYESAWMAPDAQLQFDPYSNLYENAYFLDNLDYWDADALSAGDHADLAMANLPFDAPLTTDRARQPTATGTPGWDAGTDARTVTASYHGVEGQADIVLVRADIVAQGGDVDARSRSISTPPLTIDLPRTYSAQAQAGYTISTFYPSAPFIESMRLRVAPAAGKAVLVASVRGYLPQARTYRSPGGRTIREWHLQLWGVITITDAQGALSPVRSVGMPSGGKAVVGDGGSTRRFSVAPGGRLVAGTGLRPMVLDAAGHGSSGHRAPNRAAGTPAAGSSPSGAPGLVSELRRSARISHQLRAPVKLNVGGGRFGLTLDPNYRSQGYLALSSVRLGRNGPQLARTASVPFVELDGRAIALTRGRLRDLRVMPQYPWITIGFMGFGGPTADAMWGSAYLPGLVVDAVYALTGDVYAFVNYQAAPADGDQPWGIRARVTVLALSTLPVDAAPVQYLELPEGGPVDYDGRSMTTEFSGPLEAGGETPTMATSRRWLTAAVAQAGFGGVVTVMAGPTALTADPLPDPTVSLAHGPLALFYRQPSDAPARPRGYSVLVANLVPGPEPPPADPPALGTACGSPEIVDGPAPDSAPALDVESAWFDADPANIYGTIQVRDLPATAAPGTIDSWAIHFRYAYGAYDVRATLDEAGVWAFEFGPHNLDSAIPGYSKSADLSGEVRTGADGLIRLWIPRTLLGVRNGELLRDSSARSLVESQGELTEVDQAPDGANGVWGNGADYRVGACS